MFVTLEQGFCRHESLAIRDGGEIEVACSAKMDSACLSHCDRASVAMSPLLSGDGGTEMAIAGSARIDSARLSHSQRRSVATGRNFPAATVENSGRRSLVTLGAGRGAGPLKKIERGTSPQAGEIALS